MISCASPIPYNLSPINLEPLIAETLSHGDIIELGFGQTIKTLSRKTSDDPMAEHQADYFSAIGFLKEDGSLDSNYFVLTSETWEFNKNRDWIVTQWQFRLTRSGKIIQVTHYNIELSIKGDVLTNKIIPSGEYESIYIKHMVLKIIKKWIAELGK